MMHHIHLQIGLDQYHSLYARHARPCCMHIADFVGSVKIRVSLKHVQPQM